METTVDQNASGERPKSKDLIWNVLTFLVLLGTICLVGIFSVIILFPRNLPGSHPQAALAAILPTPTPTPLVAFPATWTPQPTSLPTETSTPAPTNTPYSMATLVTPIPAATTSDVGQSTPNGSAYAFQERGQPALVASTIIHPDQGCNWFGVAGQVFDLQGAPMVGMSVQLGGTLDKKNINLLSLSGTATQYGQAGYEFTLGDKPMASSKTLWIQLLDQAGLHLSDQVVFETFEDCQKNLILINFKQVK